ncbi:hypothetical protein IQ260_02495 [Leptolyngbya cf. ectocarpi LEGE 11479]|uniref:ParD-like antitoxin of type II toxin-antitoxin system n=1 Tax=Leptolyngbya cf. ectocarpi LEGE 11479 TaxID=1828722 RepID=A0A928ZQK9_LEPEC|nr:hypothetical protein [Leptolyngbya ectocarpi]MBE9065518.1 hypothetical protein [Leptolyngbya cf. ectocarpi LEGE 11479]
MATSVRLDDAFVATAKAHAKAESRSVPKQIEYWATIGRIASENPDLPFSFIQGVLLAKAEVDSGLAKPYKRRTARTATTTIGE